MPDIVDLRSDTVTRPTAAMRRAMAEAPVGDDVYAEDPTINELEAELAERFGMGAALFVPTGTMGNQTAVRLLCKPGEELICDADAHIVSYEGGSLAMHGGVQTRTIVAERGLLDPAAVTPQLRPAGYHTVPTTAVAVELTHNRGGGAVYPLSQLEELRAVTAARGLFLHCDGARIWNAHVASGVSLATYGGLFDTMSVCLSKGLGAPVGSVVLVADADEDRGGAGAPAPARRRDAAGRHHRRRRPVRRAHSRRPAQGGPCPRPAPRRGPGRRGCRRWSTRCEVETNMVVLDLTALGTDAATVTAACHSDGVLVSGVGPSRIRLVTHLDIDDAGIDRALDVIRRALAS